MPTPLASAFIRIRPDTDGFRRETEREMGQAGRQAGQEFGEEFEDSVRRNVDADGVGDETGRRFGSAFGDSLKVAAGVAIASLGEALAAQVGQTFTAALDVTGAAGKFQAQLGLTAGESKKVGAVAGKLFSDAYGENMQDVNTAVTSVIQNIDGMKGAGSDALETMTARALTTADVLGEDVGAVTRAVSQLMRTGLAPDAQTAFDIITKGAQNGVNVAGDLLDTFSEYGTQFRKLGLDGAAATGLMTQGLKAGARDADTVADTIKEFSLKAIDGSKTTAAGFDALGLSANKMASDIAAGGPRANAALDLTLDRLRAVKNPVDQAAIAVQLFGTKAEDMGQALFALDPSEASKAMGDLAGATDRAGDAMGETAQAKFESFKRTLSTSVVEFIANNVIPVVQNLASAFSGMGVSSAGVAAVAVPMAGIGIAAKITSVAVGGVTAAIGGIKSAAGGIASATGAVGRFAQGFRSSQVAASSFSGAAGTAGGKVRSAMTAAGTAIRGAATATLASARAATTAAIAHGRHATAVALATTRTVAATVAQKAIAVATRAWAVVQTAMNVVLSANPIGLVVLAIGALVAAVVIAYKKSDTFKKIVDAAFRGVAAAGKWAWDNVLKPVFRFLGDAIKNNWEVFQRLLKIVRDVWTGVSGAVKSGWDKISGWFGRIRDGIGNVGTAFSRGANAIRTAWAKVQDFTKKPINFVIGTVYNKGIVGLWNKVMGWLKLPGSLKLGTLPLLESGGPMPVKPGIFNSPTAIVGEGNPAYPEYVIPTDPKYRGRAQALWNAAGNKIQMLKEGGILGSIKGFASKVVNIGKDALNLITNPGKVWDGLVKTMVPSAKGLATSPFGQAAATMPKLIMGHARDYALKLFKTFGDAYGGDGQGVVKAALKYIGQGDDRGMDNNNRFTRQWGYPAGTPWCALFVSTAIKDAKATKKYKGYPSAAVASYNAAMRHVPIGSGRPGDLATYGSNDHINIIVKKAAGGYDTVGGNQGPLVNRYVRGGQASVLRPLAAGGTISPDKLSGAQLREIFGQRNLDPNDSKNPILNVLRGQRRPLFDKGGFGVGWPFHARRKEAVFTDSQWSSIHKLAAQGASPSIGPIYVTGVPGIPSEKQIASAIDRTTLMHGRWR